MELQLRSFLISRLQRDEWLVSRPGRFNSEGGAQEPIGSGGSVHPRPEK
jgi:hypothetical protein